MVDFAFISSVFALTCHKLLKLVTTVQEESDKNLYARIEKLRVTRQLTWKQVGELIGLSVPMITMIKAGTRHASEKAVFRLAEIERETGIPLDTVSATPATPIPRHDQGPYWGTSCTIPIISWASAGESHQYEDQGETGPRIPTDCKDANCYALVIEGDSMAPIYQEGDVIVAAPNSEARHGDLVVAKTREEEAYFKKLQWSKDHHRVKLVSFNPNYPVMDFAKKDLRFLHPVYSVTRFFKKI